MAKRFAIGLLKGVVVGVLLTLAWLKGIGPEALSGVLGYLGMAFGGAVTGFVAGKPFWAKGALIEASLKAIVGAFFASAALYGVRKWAPVHIDIGQFGGVLGSAPALTFTAIAGLLGAMFELDNNGTELATDKTARVAPGRVRAEGETAELADDELARGIEPRLHRKG